jgi:chromate transporter
MIDSANSADGEAGQPALKNLAWVFARYANFTLGGGSATTATLHRQIVEKRRWLLEDRFLLCFALGRLTPGTNVLAFCTGVGWVLRGMAGAVTTLFAASIPCAIMVTVLTALFSYWQDNQFAQAAIHGAIAAAVAITVKTCWTIAKPYYKGQARLRVVLVALAAFLLYVGAEITPIEVLLLAATIGALLPVGEPV